MNFTLCDLTFIRKWFQGWYSIGHKLNVRGRYSEKLQIGIHSIDKTIPSLKKYRKAKIFTWKRGVHKAMLGNHVFFCDFNELCNADCVVNPP